MILHLNPENMQNTFHSGLNFYLMRMTKTTQHHVLKYCLSSICLFDGYLIEALFSSKGLSKGHFVPYRSNAFVASFSWTLKQSKAVKSYLTSKLHKAVRRPMFPCKSTDSLFDGHMIVVSWALLILNQ